MNYNDLDKRIDRVLEASTHNFVELTKIAGLDPAKDFRYANLSKINFSGCSLAGFDFRGASFEGATFVDAKIAGAKFSPSTRLRRLLRVASDADEVFEAKRRRRQSRRRKISQWPGHQLTPRETDVTQLVIKGLSNNEIGRQMHLSEGTVKIHLHNIYKKLNISTRTALAIEVTKRVKIEEIQRIVARQYNVSRADLLSSRRTANVVRPRQVAMYLAKTLTLRSLPEIGRRFDRHPTTIARAARMVESTIIDDTILKNEIALLLVQIT
jgi:DNA-binding CsgD family transcriptional regulator